MCTFDKAITLLIKYPVTEIMFVPFRQTIQKPRNSKLSKELGRASMFWSIGWRSMDFVGFGANRGETSFIVGSFYERGHFTVNF